MPLLQLLPDKFSFVSPEISRTSNTVSAKVDWTIYMKFTSNALTQTGYLYMTLPDDVVYDMSETLDIVLTTNSSAAVTHSKTLYSSGAIESLTFNSVCGSSGCAVDSFLTVQISWIKNPPAQSTVTSGITITSKTTEGYVIDKGTTAAVNSLFSALEVVPITNIDITPSDPSAGASTSYNVIFTADTDIPQNSYVLITLPTELGRICV